MALKVAELFAGVGGFRLGLEKNGFKIIWSNQWEPLTKTQHASMVYEKRFGKENHSNVPVRAPSIHAYTHTIKKANRSHARKGSSARPPSHKSIIIAPTHISSHPHTLFLRNTKENR